MTIEQPRFPTPEEERRAALLYEVLRALADLDKATSWEPDAQDVEEPVEASRGSTRYESVNSRSA
jgi:hypothetical protein